MPEPTARRSLLALGALLILSLVAALLLRRDKASSLEPLALAEDDLPPAENSASAQPDDFPADPRLARLVQMERISQNGATKSSGETPIAP